MYVHKIRVLSKRKELFQRPTKKCVLDFKMCVSTKQLFLYGTRCNKKRQGQATPNISHYSLNENVEVSENKTEINLFFELIFNCIGRIRFVL